jgi:hypothetical protein
VRVLPWQILLFASLLLSFFPIYHGFWGGYYDRLFLWKVVFDPSPYVFMQSTIGLAYGHLIITIISFVLYVTRSDDVNKFEGFPSIKDAIKYQKEKLMLKKLEKKHLKKQKIDQAKSLYLYKMQQIEEEKKKYL